MFDLFSQKDFRFEQPIKKKEVCTFIYYDVDSLPFKKEWLINQKLDSSIYIDINGNISDAYFALVEFPKFNGGFDSLIYFFNSHLDIPKEIETNGKVEVLFFIDKDRFETRILRKIGYDCKYFNYDIEVKRVLALTKTKWETKHLNTQKPIVFYYYFHIP
jgi:hypothetical protein